MNQSSKRKASRLPAIPALLLLAAGVLVPALADGLPGEYLVTGRWRTLLASTSPVNNPAMLTELNYLNFRLASSTTLGEFYMHELGFTLPIGLYQSAGLTWLTLGTNAFEKTSWNGDSILATGSKISDNQNLIMLSYAINPWDRLSVGANLNIAHQNLFGETQEIGFGLDAGVSYRLAHHPVIGDHIAGAMLQNLIAPSMLGSGEELSRGLRFSLLSNYAERAIESSFDFTLKDFITKKGEFNENAVSEPEFDLNGRVGGWFLRIFNLYALFGLDKRDFTYWGFAAGVNIPTINFGRDFAMTYQMLYLPGSTTATHTWYVRGDFGLHREEAYARHMAHMADVTPSDLYNRALVLYSSRNYWDAYFVFGTLIAEYPDFFKADWVGYYMASCQEELDMRSAAQRGYAQVKGTFARSTAVSFADLGLMRLYYREGRHNDVQAQLVELDRSETGDSLRQHAYYIMGQSLIREKEYSRAFTYLDRITSTHPQYLFAQQSIAHVNIMLARLPDALSAFQACYSTPAVTPAQKEVVNRAFLMHGYLLFENPEQFENAQPRAVVSLRKVAKESYYYEDAMLGLGWTAIRARQLQDGLDAAEALIRVSRNPTVRAEGGLIKGYCLLTQQKYLEAVTALSDALALIEQPGIPADDSLFQAKRQYEDTREQYDTLAQKAMRLALTRKSAYVVGQKDSLALRQKSLRGDIDTYLRFVDETDRMRLFALGAKTTAEDIQYALARAKKMAGIKDHIETKKKVEETNKNIDSEIQKLQDEMKKLEEGNK